MAVQPKGIKVYFTRVSSDVRTLGIGSNEKSGECRVPAGSEIHMRDREARGLT